WAAAFSLLIFMHQGLGMFSYLETGHLAFWFFTSAVLFGTERILMLALFRRLMAKGVYLQNAVILGGTDNGVRVAEYLASHRGSRTGVLGVTDARPERLPRRLTSPPLLGNTRGLEQENGEEEHTQVPVALTWFADSCIAQVMNELRKLP